MPIYRGDGSPTAGDDMYDQADLDAAVGYAEEWANKAEDSLVSTAAGGDGVDDYSSLHHAAKASASATAASTSASNAATSESNAASSASAAATSASNAATSETNAATSESNAATSASNAATSESNAAASEAAAATSYDNFDDRYLGQKASDPTLDNDGNALLTGALYFNTTSNEMMVYTGSVWQTVATIQPSLSGNALRFLRVNSGATATEWFDLLATTNTFTAYQRISGTTPFLVFHETDTTDQNFGWYGAGGSFFLSKVNDADTPTATKIQVDNDALKLGVYASGIDSSGTVRSIGSGVPASGAGVEMLYTGTAGYVQAYDRTGSAYKPLNLEGSSCTLRASGAARLTCTTILTASTHLYMDASNYGLYMHRDAVTQCGLIEVGNTSGSGIGYVTAGTASGDGSNSVALYLRSRYLGTPSNGIIIDSNSATLQIKASNYTYSSEPQRKFHGRQSAGGTAVRLPSGWSSSNPVTGQVRVTHNLGTTAYSVCVSLDNTGSGVRIGDVVRSSNYFDIYTYGYNNTTATGAATQWILTTD